MAERRQDNLTVGVGIVPLDFASVEGQPEYQHFRQAVAQKKLPLVIVCGAGLSAPAGLPTWRELRKRLEAEATQKVNSLAQLGQQLTDSKLKSAKATTDFWLAFKLLSEILGPPTFRNSIVSALRVDDNTPTPRSYLELVQLQPKGIVTLNLDKFAGEAMFRANPSKPPSPVYGMELAQKWDTITFSPQYLVYLHGELTNPDTWVFTSDQLASLQQTKGHEYFLHKLYTESLVLFVGVTVDDISLSSRLLDFKESGFRPPALYWLTPRLDVDTSKWADDNNISLIKYYAATNAEHESVIEAIVKNILSYLPADDPAPKPIIKNRFFDTQGGPNDPEELAQLAPEVIRKLLSDRLEAKLIDSTDFNLYSTFQDFCRIYDYAIDRAFYKADGDRFRQWFDYAISFPSLGKGNFGEVFRAVSKTDKEVALKIINRDILKDNNMLGGFRRGVRSMKILTDSKVSGTARIIDSFELPPTIVMEYVLGQTLQDAIEATPMLPWLVRLRILVKVAEIVFAGHSLPETVMHRDLKPSNIMIRDFEFDNTVDPDVLVLDFDMSWHKGANEKDVVFESRDDFGYLAPEQTKRDKNISAVSTRVDSYGLGMTAYYIFGGQHPRPNEGLGENWFEIALKATKSGYKGTWKSAPSRLARIIRDCTAIEQYDRLDFSVANRELQGLLVAVADPSNVSNPELWAEEVIARLPSAADYRWNSDDILGEIILERGIRISARPDFRNKNIDLKFEFLNQGGQQYKGLTAKITSIPMQMRRIMTQSGWNIIDINKGLYQLTVDTRISISSLIVDSSSAFHSATEAYKIFETLGGVW